MSPDQQRNLNVERFKRLLGEDCDPERRSRIEKLLAEERAKPDSAYPADTSTGPRAERS
jgi:hypothetical protein